MVGYVTSDNGAEFRGEFNEQLVRYGIPQITISAYNPAANGANERGHAVLKEAMLKASLSEGDDWVRWLPYALWADRTTARRSTGYSSYQLLYGQHAIFPVDLEYSTFLMEGWDEVHSTEDLLRMRMIQLWNVGQDREVARHQLQESRDASVMHHNDTFNRRFRDRDFKVGDMVLVRNAAQDNTMKVKKEPRFRGPYRITKVSRMGAADLQELDGTTILDRGLHHVGHNRLRRFQDRSDRTRYADKQDKELRARVRYPEPSGNEPRQQRELGELRDWTSSSALPDMP